MPEFITSKITSKSQTVIPQAVREKLALHPGDLIRYKLMGNAVQLEKVSASAKEDPFAFFSEWSSAADDTLFKDL